jgi:hypothetical protein
VLIVLTYRVSSEHTILEDGVLIIVSHISISWSPCIQGVLILSTLSMIKAVSLLVLLLVVLERLVNLIYCQSRPCNLISVELRWSLSMHASVYILWGLLIHSYCVAMT